MGNLRQDVHQAMRVLRNSPGFALIAILTLAIGIGANTAIFSVVNGVLLRPLDYPQAERIMAVSESSPAKGLPTFPASPANYLDWKQQAPAFAHLAAFNGDAFTWKNGARPEHLNGAHVTGEFFDVVGVQPMLGRGFLAEEEQPGHGRVVVLSEKLWRTKFGADKALIGRGVVLDGATFTVIGVMPARMKAPDDAELWAPLAFTAQDAAVRGAHSLGVVGRLRDGISQQEAQAQMRDLAQRLQQQYPTTNRLWTVAMQPIQEQLVGGVRTALLVLLGAVACVLLIACANVANLLLARASARTREISIRAALGASRARIVRQFLTESLTLSFIGGGLGLLLAWSLMRLLSRLNLSEVPRLTEVAIDPAVLAFTLAATTLTGILFGLAPALQVSRSDLNLALRQSGRASAGARARLVRNGLVVSELALALVLLTGAGLTLRSLYALFHVDPGFRSDHLLTASLYLADSRYPKKEQQTVFYQRLLEHMREIPGVKSAGAATVVPLTDNALMISFNIVGRNAGQDESAAYNSITPDYFEAMGIRLLHGRWFTEHDNEQSQPVAIISETFARQFFANEDPIGKSIHMGTRGNRVRQIVGVVSDVRVQSLSDSRPRAAMYEPFFQNSWASMTLAIRSDGNPVTLIDPLRKAVAAVDPDQPVDDIATMVQLKSASLTQQRLAVGMLGAFGVLALALSALGVYGVMAYLVTQRIPEIGVRMALGATVGDVLRLVLQSGFSVTVTGIGLGLAAALAVTRLLKTMLYEVTTTDPSTFVLVAGLLALTAFLACLIPARRAARVDPVIALRNE